MKLNLKYVAAELRHSWAMALTHCAANESPTAGIVMTIDDEANIRTQFVVDVHKHQRGSVILHVFSQENDLAILRSLWLQSLENGTTPVLDSYIRRAVAMLPAYLEAAADCPDKYEVLNAITDAFYRVAIIESLPPEPGTAFNN